MEGERREGLMGRGQREMSTSEDEGKGRHNAGEARSRSPSQISHGCCIRARRASRPRHPAIRGSIPYMGTLGCHPRLWIMTQNL